MKTIDWPLLLLFAVCSAACSSYPPLEHSDGAGNRTSVVGPWVGAVHVVPSADQAEIGIQVKAQPGDAPIVDVRVAIIEAPIQIQLRRIQGDLWQGVLPPDKVRQLSIPGQTALYHARIIIRDQKGSISMGAPAVQLSVTAQGVVGSELG